MKELIDKREALSDKRSRLVSGKEHNIQLAANDARRKNDRSKRQWEADEKIAFEKILSTKAEAMKKLAADSLGPKMDRLVMDGKDKVRVRSDEINGLLSQLRQTLQAELDSKLADTIDRLKEELKEGSERVQKIAEKKIDELRRRQEGEVEAARKGFVSERKVAEELVDRGRRVDGETAV